MAKATYLIQGLNEEVNHDNKINELLSRHFPQVYIYSAFVNKNGVIEIEEELKNNEVTMLVGIRNGITTKQGLERLLEAGVNVYVIDTGSRADIFHPKTVVGVDYSSKVAEIIIGSANVTSGGLRKNIENGAIIHLDLSDKDDMDCLDQFLSGFNSLVNDFSSENVFLIKTNQDVEVLFDAGRVVDEKQSRTINSVGTDKGGKKIVKKMPLKIGKSKKKTSKSHKEESASSDSMSATVGSFVWKVSEVWKSKGLVERDLGTPSGGNTNATGSMLMKRGAYKIDQQSYFRKVVFNELVWEPKGKKSSDFEFAKAKFHFLIEGVSYGPYELELKNDLRTDTKTYKQKQPTVSLSWGKEAGQIIKNRYLLGKILHLYAIEGKEDEFLIEIRDD